jgi:hypothetical protein
VLGILQCESTINQGRIVNPSNGSGYDKKMAGVTVDLVTSHIGDRHVQ